eukprot:CAMPEP_0194316116 /NCGR_PEP_ID=MMETSP0171-20130528/12930_1 /TAXON_ID=218684 /ORGANISM="Corethron pennatum, Strain L29A3" /LENGTH=195 /DNA_ID=CAMNT_0039072235 /DNA_START=298 /DNA_END=886 /DNA_ORIENTATION=-
MSPVIPEVEGGWTAPSTPICCSTPTPLNAVNDVDAASVLHNDNFTPETYIRGMKSDASSISMLQPLTNLIESDLMGPMTELMRSIDAANASTAKSNRWTPPLRESPDKSNETCLEVEADTVLSTNIALRNINIDLKNEAQPGKTNGSQNLGQMLNALDDEADEDRSSSSLSSSSSSLSSSSSSSSFGPVQVQVMV